MVWDYKTECTISNGGVLRWISNGRVPPAENCEEAKAQGLLVSVARCKEARAADDHAFIEAYRKNPPEMTAEDLAEARSVLGAGAVVMNVLTGRRVD